MLEKRSVRCAALVLAAALLTSLVPGRLEALPAVGEEALRQIQAILADKATRTPGERRLATSLLMAYRQSQGQAMVQGLRPLPRVVARAGVDARGMVVVDVEARVSESLLQSIADVGGEVLSAYPAYGAVRARLPVRRLGALAALPGVRFVRPKARAIRAGSRSSRGDVADANDAAIVNAGSLTSEGDVAHTADTARTSFSVAGTGTRVCVLSDGVYTLAARQATNDLPPTCPDPPPATGSCVAVLPGQGGLVDQDYGTAMLEIVHDLAPGAQLFFATSDAGLASFAANIQALHATYGCDVLVDDVTYIGERAFQDGPLADAINAVTTAGALYFSSAGISGRLSAGASGTWEGDFVDSLTPLPPGFANTPDLQGYPQRPVHSFNGLTGGAAAASNPLIADAFDAITLQWSDPWGAAVNDYDLFLLSSDLSLVVDWSYDDQECPPPTDPTTCSPDPYEQIGFGYPGERIVITKFSGQARALRVDTYGGVLTFATDGAIAGHAAAERAVAVAAVDVATAGGGAFAGGAANPVETYSSDGPRRLFFNRNGTEITPGNVLFATNGGRDREKPDVTAADCVSVSTPGYTPLCGTSSSAAHAAAIAALLKSTPNAPSGGQALAAMFATALDVNPAGRDKDSGVGIVMANAAADVLVNIPAADYYTLTPCRSFDTRQAGGATGGAPLTCGSDYEFTVTGGTCGVPGTARAISLNVTVTSPTSGGNVRLFASGAPAPQASSLNYVAGLTRGNNAVVPISDAGKIGVRCAPSGTAHVIVDVNGYFQ